MVATQLEIGVDELIDPTWNGDDREVYVGIDVGAGKPSTAAVYCPGTDDLELRDLGPKSQKYEGQIQEQPNDFGLLLGELYGIMGRRRVVVGIETQPAVVPSSAQEDPNAARAILRALQHMAHMVGALADRARQLGATVYEIAPASAKVALAEDGRATGPDMTEAVKRIYHRRVNQDQAHAIGNALAAMMREVYDAT